MFNLRVNHLAKQLLLVAVLMLTANWGLAQIPPAAQAAQADAAAVTVVRSLALVAPGQQTLQQMQAMPRSNWQAFDANTTYPTKEGMALWIQLQLSVSSPPTGWSIKLPKPYIDRVELHLPSASNDVNSASGAWTVQSAGDRVAHRDWPVRGLHPQFLLPALPAGEHTIFLKISNAVPFNITVLVHSLQQDSSDSLGHLFRSMGITILLLCIAFFSVSLALIYRDTAYAWYSAYALSAALATAAYTGLANYLLWPDSTYWSDRSIHVSLLVCVALQIIFCYVTFEPQKIWPRFQGVLWFSGSLTSAGLLAIFVHSNVHVYTAGLLIPTVLNLLLMICMVAVRLRQGVLSAKLWMLAYTPLSALIVVTALEGFGFFQAAMVGYYWPLYALALEVPVLLLALMLRVKSRDAYAVTQHTRQQLDPLTGFVLPRAYQGIALPMWERASSLEADLAVVYVQITQPTAPFLVGSKQAPGSERIVRVLRTVFRQEDTFARLSKDVYAVVMPDTSLGEPLQNRLSRLVAQIHMLSLELKTDYLLRTRISTCTTQSLPVSWVDVHRILLEKFDNEKNWGKSTIRIVSKRHSKRADDTDLSNFWARAYGAETNSSGNATT